MARYCKLTGVDLSGDGATNGFKCMCLNCVSCNDVIDPSLTFDDERFTCDNEKVMQVGIKKIMEALPEGFEIETITLKPMALKDPTKKCKNYVPDVDKVVDFVTRYYTGEENEKENASE